MLGTAVTWGVSWAVAAVPVAFGLLAAIQGTPLPVGSFVLRVMTVFGLAGLGSGAAFSLLLGTVYRNRRLDQLRPGRMGLWGMAAALGLASGGLFVLTGAGAFINVPMTLAMLGTAGGLGWATAAGTVKLAQLGGRLGSGPDVPSLSEPGAGKG